ncbi:MAG: Hsp33 family molecular chaperone HslO [Candidatus Eisenbacteria sp.]|nr:Hsp33 family molecular chaperone HslO [Candidatus Eisenbacteria bacterium]
MAREVVIDRYMSRERNVLAARGVFTALFGDYIEHSRRWVGDPDGLVLAMMRQGLAAAALYLTCRPRDEETAWTVNLPEPPLNLFFVADAAVDTVTGRFFDRHVQAEPHGRLFVQLVRPSGQPHQSVIDVTGFDVLLMLERYYAESEQATARFFEYDEDAFLMLMALPDVDEPWLRSLSREEGEALLHEPGMVAIEQRSVRFLCSCTYERILDVAVKFFRGQPEELFGTDGGAEFLCPRCGCAHWIERSAFDAAL